MKSSHTEEKQVYRNTAERKVVSKGISGERTPKSPKMGTGLNQSHWFGGKDTVREVNQRLAGSSTGNLSKIKIALNLCKVSGFTLLISI